MPHIVQLTAVDGPVTEPTQAWVMFDDDTIYIACRCSDARPETIESKDMRRDSSTSVSPTALA